MSGKKKENKAFPTIKDPLLGDYFIEIGDDTFNLFYQSKGAKEPRGIAYFREFKNVLKEVLKYRFNEHYTGEAMTIKEYIDRYEKMLQNFEKAIKI